MQTEVNGIKYEFGRMDARTQFHVTRRLGPLLSTLQQMAGMMEALSTMGKDGLFAITGPVMERLAMMDEGDLNYIINACLRVTQREQSPTSRVPMLAGDGHTIMFADMDGKDLMALVVKVLEGNLGNFFELAFGFLQTDTPQTPSTSQ